MSARATTLAQGFSQKLLKEMYDRSMTDVIVNRDYQGSINEVGSKLNILNFDRLTEKTYTNSAMSADSLTENNAVLTIDQYKSFYWKEKTLENWLSYIKDPHPTIVEQKAAERNKNMDSFVLGLYGDVAAGNRIGTDVTNGTVAIDASGNVTGTSTAFTAAMVGRGFQAGGHTKWYRVKTFNSSTSIVIEDDKDDVTSAYTGGVIGAGATNRTEAVSAVQLTTTNFLQQIAKMKRILDAAERDGKSDVPDEDRVLIVPPEFEELMIRATGVVLNVPAAYEELIKKGMIGQLQGFNIFKTNRLTGNNTNGFRVLAIQKNWCTFAEKLLQATIEEDLIGDFGTAYKDLFVYGAKVADSRRHFAVEGFFTFNV